MTDTFPLLLSDDVIGLRRPEPSDGPGYHRMRNDLVTVEQLISFNRGVSTAKVDEWIRGLGERPDELVLTAVVPGEAHRPVGFIKVFNIDPLSGSCRLGLALFDSAADGRKGYGGHMLTLLLRYLATSLRMRKVTLEVIDDNLPAMKLYLSHGFVEEGRLKDQYYIGGRFRTVVLMSKFLAREEAAHGLQ
ncbi:GNAT family N-acetyltransferase [Dongia sp.]|uniref:GNAT family N-acetyltransferase n=1 Tax=Dongia sp. TaxID=1977262 RepID=UPI0035AE93CA